MSLTYHYYYPTPISVVKLIKSYMVFPEEPFCVIDPCCGEGAAIAEFVQHTGGLSYGVELDEARADEAKKALYKVAKGAIETSRITNEGFSVNFLNPPYDDEAGTEFFKQQRKEKLFLKKTYEYLKKSGVLVYIIPQNRLTEDIVKILVYRFRKLQVFKFPHGEYEAFSQIVVFGIRKDVPSVDKEEAQRLSTYWDHTEEPPELTETLMPQYVVSPSNPVPLFRSSIIDPLELIKDVRKSTLWGRVAEIGVRREAAATGARPPIPLHKGHMGLALVSGALDGCVGKGDHRHLVKGRVVKEVYTITEEEITPSGNYVEKTVEKDRYKVTVQLLTKDGDVLSLM